MNLSRPASVFKTIRSYYHDLDSSLFEQVTACFLEHQGRKTFDLKTQYGLRTLIELHADTTTLSAYLLFQLPDEKRASLPLDEHTLRLMQGLDGLREITSLEQARLSQSSESVRKMFLAMSRDLRVVLVLVAFRYAELLELDQQSPELRRQIARQTLDIFVPITGRLGIYTLKRQLEDLCFSFLSGAEYDSLLKAFERREELKESTIDHLIEKVKEFLHDHGIQAEVSGRVKGKYSTYMKLKRKGGGSLDEISDLLALRVIVGSQVDCYTVLSLINNHWNAITGRFKDYIAMPKVNGYRSLHTTVLGMIEGSARSVEVQIRTEEMHREAEYGIAAHWWYEEDGIKDEQQHQFVGRDAYEDKLQWVKNLVQLQDTLDGKGKESEQLNFFSDRIFVMTLNGQVIELPKGSTPLDFAYALSDSLGHHCAKAKVNDSVVPLDYELKNGDRVFVVKKMEASPNLYWLSLVKTKRARRAIQKWLLEQGEDTVFDRGLRMINKRLRSYRHPVLDEEYSLLKHYKGDDLTQEQIRNLIMSVGKGDRDADEVVQSVIAGQELRAHQRVAFAPLSQKKKHRGKVTIAGETGFRTKLAACCDPEEGDHIVGYVTRGDFISVHKEGCKVLASLDRLRFIEAWWSGKEKPQKQVRFEVSVQMTNVLEQLSKYLKEHQIMLMGFFYDKAQVGYTLTFDVQVKDHDQAQAVLESWKGYDGVEEVELREPQAVLEA